MKQNNDSPWVSDGLPSQGVVVIIEFEGDWPHRGNGGITDSYAWDNAWFNLPATVTVTRWMFIPD